jgi:cell division protein FtsB
LDFQYNRKTARDLPRRPVSQRHNQRVKSQDLFSAEPSLSPQDGPNIVNNSSVRQKLGRAGVNEFSSSNRGTAPASQVKYTNSANQNIDRKAATRAELLKRRADLQQRLSTKGGAGSGTPINKLPGRVPGSVSARSTNGNVSVRTPSPAARRTVNPSKARATKPRTTTVRPKTRGALKREEYLLKGLWICFGFLFLRLIFMENGVIDYYNMETALEYKHDVHLNLIAENKDLVKEIKLIKTSATYQKKLAREHLGVIDRDEFLILFAGQKASKSNQ